MSYHEENPSKGEIDRLFAKYYIEEYVPESGEEKEHPIYTATPVNSGPKPITIDEYRRKYSQKKEVINTRLTKKPKRGGKRLKLRAQKKELLRLIGISSGDEKRTLYLQLRSLNGKPEVKNPGNNNCKQQQ